MLIGRVDNGGVIEQLQASEFEVVLDVLETDGGTWELIDDLQGATPRYMNTKVQHGSHFSIYDVALTIALQPPLHIRMVYQRSEERSEQDPNSLQSTPARGRTSWPSSCTSIQDDCGLYTLSSLIEAIHLITGECSFYRSCNYQRPTAHEQWRRRQSPISTGASSRSPHIFTGTE